MFYLNDKAFLRHTPGREHPERPERLTAIDEAVNKAPWRDRLQIIEAVPASPDHVALVHDRGYIEQARRDVEMGRSILSTGDTAICPDSFDTALRAVGGVLAMVEGIFSPALAGARKSISGFCAVRPPGHHASSHKGMGFCMFNNASIAARYAQSRFGAERILIIDWDVHHGNGTQDIFYRDDSVLFMSIHQFPWYPGTGGFFETGEGKGVGFTLNRPFAAGAGDREIIGAFLSELLPAARNFKADFTIVSSGFDSRAGDPLGYLRLTNQGFRDLTRIVLEMAYVAGEGRLLSVLEGGYDLDGTASAAVAHMEEMISA